MEKYEWLTVLCSVLGWIYFFAWSISFYPQTIVNFKRKCVIGMSFDYMGIYNFTGFLFYSAYSIATFVHYHGTANAHNPIAVNDIAFATHALLLTSVCCVQILIYDRGTQKPSVFAVCLGALCWIIAIYNVMLSFLGDPNIGVMDETVPWFGHFSTVSFLGYVKVAVTTIKYIPQVGVLDVDALFRCSIPTYFVLMSDSMMERCT